MSKKYTNAITTFSSKEGQFQFKKEMIDEARMKKRFDVFKGISKFEAVVLSWNKYLNSGGTDIGKTAAGTGNLFLACYVRPLKIQGFLIPPPCASNDAQTQQCIISLHPIAFSTHAILDGRETSIKVGDIITCYFSDEGPEFQGKLRGLRFDSSEQRTALGGFNLDCLEDLQDKKFRAAPNVLEESIITYTGKGPVLNSYTTNHSAVGSHDGTDRSNGCGLVWTYAGNHPNWKGKSINNGSLPAELLGYAKEGIGHGHHSKTPLMREIIQHYDNLAKAYKEKWGENLHASGYRDFSGQLDSKARYGGMAATPGCSKHGWGLAFDIKPRKWHKVPSGYELPEYKWMWANAGRYGFHNPGWAAQATCKDQCEPWHWEWKNTRQLVARTGGQLSCKQRTKAQATKGINCRKGIKRRNQPKELKT